MRNFLLLVALLTCCTHTLYAGHLSDRLTFSARLNPMPNQIGNGNGVAAFMLNNTRDTLFVSMSVAKLSSPIVAYHIRKNNHILVDFDRKVLGNTVRTFITGNELKQLLPPLLKGELTITVPSQKYPTGELQGPIQLETDWSFSTQLFNPSKKTAAVGLATLTIGMNTDTLMLRVSSALTEKITGIYVCKNTNVQPEIILDLSELIDANSPFINDGWKLSSNEWNEIAPLLISNQLQLTIATTQEPQGALTGVFTQNSPLQFDGWATPTETSTILHISAGLSLTFDTLYYSIFTNIQDAVTIALHDKNGNTKNLPIIQPITQGIWTMSDAINPLTSNIINQLLSGKVTCTLSNNNFTNIEASVVKFAREGFIAELTQLLNETESGGQGTAVASYDRDRQNIHCMFAFDGLQGILRSTQISFGKKGEAGSVEMSTEPFTNNGSYKYLRTAEIFEKTKSLKIAKKEHTYLIIETTMYEDGEISGLFKWNYKTMAATADTAEFSGLGEDLITNGSFKVFPNPTTNSIQVNMVAKVDGFSTLTISNTNGEELVKQTTAIEKGRNTLSLDMSQLFAGIYFIELSINGIPTSNTKVIKQ